MKNRLVIFLAAFEFALVALAIYFEPTCRVRGTLRGEASYAGRPTSYWRGVVDQYEMTFSDGVPGRIAITGRQPTMLDRIKTRWGFEGEVLHFKNPPVWWDFVDLINNADAEPVLREMLQDRSLKVRRFAEMALPHSLTPNPSPAGRGEQVTEIPPTRSETSP